MYRGRAWSGGAPGNSSRLSVPQIGNPPGADAGM